MDGLRNHPRYKLFPFDELIPATTSFDYLDHELISQFGVFLKQAGGATRGDHQRFEVAAIGKLRNPSAFDAKAELAKWRNRTTPWRADQNVEIEEIQVVGQSCYRFETGTVFNSVHRQGLTHFFDRNGEKKDNGISVGQATARGFIEGGDGQSKAVISVAGVTESDLMLSLIHI